MEDFYKKVVCSFIFKNKFTRMIPLIVAVFLLLTSLFGIASFMEVQEQVNNLKRIDSMRVRAALIQVTLQDLEQHTYHKFKRPDLFHQVGELSYNQKTIKDNQDFLFRNMRTSDTEKQVKKFNTAVDRELEIISKILTTGVNPDDEKTLEELSLAEHEVETLGTEILKYWDDNLTDRKSIIDAASRKGLVVFNFLGILSSVFILGLGYLLCCSLFNVYGFKK